VDVIAPDHSTLDTILTRFEHSGFAFGLCPKWGSKGYEADCDYDANGVNSGSEIAAYNAVRSKSRLASAAWSALGVFNSAIEDDRGAVLVGELAAESLGSRCWVETQSLAGVGSTPNFQAVGQLPRAFSVTPQRARTLKPAPSEMEGFEGPFRTGLKSE
jgi:hypothetical protein